MNSAATKLFAGLFVLALAAPISQAKADVACSDLSVTAVGANIEGDLWVSATSSSVHFDHKVVCSLEGAGCKAFMTLLLAAKLSTKKVDLWFHGDTCPSGDWAPASLYHAELNR